MVVHHLGHRRCHAAGGASAAAAPTGVGGAEVVVRRALVPLCLDQGSYGVCAVRADLVAGACGTGLRSGVLLQPGYLVGVALQPGSHVVGDAVQVDVAALAEAEDRACAVVVGDDDEAAVVLYVEDIEPAHLALQAELRRLSLCLARPPGNGGLACQEIESLLLSLLRSDVFCPRAAHAEQGKKQCHHGLCEGCFSVHFCGFVM